MSRVLVTHIYPDGHALGVRDTEGVYIPPSIVSQLDLVVGQEVDTVPFGLIEYSFQKAQDGTRFVLTRGARPVPPSGP